MVTDSMIKQRFIHETMSKGINTILTTQEKTVNTYLNKRSGQLSDFISSRPFTNTSSEGSEIYYMRVLSYLRFLDIGYRRSKDRLSRHLRSNLALYNRVVWGVLYHETFPELQYGLRQEIHDQIKAELEAALNDEQSNN
jgi:hypothetical protein